MINRADQYQFVTGADVDATHPHGDLDRILIDGGIMPLRGDPADRTPLRGEDVAFLQEGLCERGRMAGYGGLTDTFSRRVCYENFANLYSRLCDILPESGSWRYQKRDFDEGVVDDTSYFQNPSFGYYRGDFDLSWEDWKTGAALKRSMMMDLFGSAAKLTRSGFHTTSATWPEWSVTTTGSSMLPIIDIQPPEFYRQRFSRGESGGTFVTSEDYEQTATIAKFTVTDERIGYAKSVEAWAILGLSGLKIDYTTGETIFQRSGYYAKRLASAAPDGDSVLVDVSALGGKMPSLLQSVIGYTPSRPTIDHNYAELGSAAISRLYLSLDLRDRTRWS